MLYSMQLQLQYYQSSGMAAATCSRGHFCKMGKILVLLVVLETAATLYAPYFRRCRVLRGAVDADAVPIEDLSVERFPNYSERHMSHPVITPEIDLDYTDYNYYLHSFIDSGGSGEVFLVEDVAGGEGKVLKRYFKERPEEFRRESFLMKQLNYSMGWTKYCQGVDKCSEEDTEYHSIAIFPYKESIIFRNLQFDGEEGPLFFYKMLREMDKIHRAGVIHNDIKMGNIMVNSMGLNFKFYEIQFIDWNLAMFYHTGLDTKMKQGTVCFYSPEQIFRTQYVNPSRDIWALGVAMFTFYTDQKPFSHNCKKDNLKAIATLVGAEKLLALIKKYNYNTLQHLAFVKELENNIDKYPQKDLAKFRATVNQKYYTKDLVDVFKRMLEPDPEKRATAAELMKMKYFRNITTLPDLYYSRDKKKAQQKKTVKTATKSPKSNQKQAA